MKGERSNASLKASQSPLRNSSSTMLASRISKRDFFNPHPFPTHILECFLPTDVHVLRELTDRYIAPFSPICQYLAMPYRSSRHPHRTQYPGLGF